MTRTFIQVDEVSAADDIASRSCAEALRVLNKQISLFTPALMVTHGYFDRDPVMEFDARFPAESADLRPFCIDLTRDNEFFFTGLGATVLPGRKTPTNWDKRLYGIAQDREEECFAFLSGIAFSNVKTGFFASTFAYDLTIPDPTSKFNEVLKVKVFAVVSNQFISMLSAQLNGPPVVKKIPTMSNDSALNFLRHNGILSSFSGVDPLTEEE